MDEFDIAIVGAGPVGLFLACELGLAGCSVVVLEREPGPRSPWRAAPLGTRGLTTASIEAFYRRGMLDPLLSASGLPAVTGVETDADERAQPSFAGHFAAMTLDPAHVDLAAFPFRLPSPGPEMLMADLEAVESVLYERATKLGVQVEYGVTVSGISQDDERAVVHTGGHGHAARWVVGCDGGRSVVRGFAGFEFVGTEPMFTGYTLLATIADPEKLRPGFNLTPQGAYIRMPRDGHLGMMDFDGGAFDRSRQPTREHLQEVLRRISGTDVTLTEIHLASSFTDRAMQTTTYRRGRVLLAGDAAHIHSPMGGQGLNTGLGDAMNLGWKLAATVHGHAPDGLLDTYTEERHPIGARVLDWSRAQAATMRPGPYAQALQGVVRDLLGTRDGTTYVYGRVSGASIHYDVGGEHPLIGHDAPDFRLADGTRLGDLMQDGRGLALELTGDHHLRDTAAKWENRIQYVTGTAHNNLGVSALLVRPDGVVAWADTPTPNPTAFESALGTWFGTP
ncbi:2-polyprenyl-6-methoxyphenol hydroxylase-like FAD-dependent oxidoreductase [Nocardia tenerifensis]|uniref:2-polyprenyl-6-methoxyphenol hydroxylase-like FAD-dependent oxidoreductase n=1 Tax=Nocardia tenerifensis TaxID=228006 RepID=A0A318KAF6_9NOCA|nr:FAD-dependent oxidoreductase [Nocardia tenerifensis]PXX61682.1 2-polyprenyl-6-methoxyphenol hydroxylase-like FAD-dependent oxidoreductase [Nocardia tenerifensis]